MGLALEAGVERERVMTPEQSVSSVTTFSLESLSTSDTLALGFDSFTGRFFFGFSVPLSQTRQTVMAFVQ